MKKLFLAFACFIAGVGIVLMSVNKHQIPPAVPMAEPKPVTPQVVKGWEQLNRNLDKSRDTSIKISV
jgi:hypothetical protein